MDLDAAVRVAPRNAHAYHLRGVLRTRLQDLRGAFKDHDSAVRLAPKNPTYMIGRSHLHRLNNRWDEAFADAHRAVGLAPRMPNVHYHLATLLALKGDRSKALDALEKAVALGFSRFDFMRASTELEGLRDEPRFKRLLKDR